MSELESKDTASATRQMRGVSVTRRQVVVILIGVLLVLGGLLVVIAPDLLAVSPEVLNLVGILTLACFVYFGILWTLLDTDVIESPAVERRVGLELAGEEFERSIQRRAVTDDELVPVIEENVRQELRQLAADVLARDADRTESAKTQLDERTWTENDVAGKFLDADSISSSKPARTPSQDGENDSPPNSTFSGRVTTLPVINAVVGTWTTLQKRLSQRERNAFESSVEQTVHELATVGSVEPSGVGQWIDTTIEGRPDEWQTGVTTTNQWRGLTGLSLLTLGLGGLFQVPGLVLVAGLLLGVLGYTRITSLPELELSVEREFDTEHPAPGDTVTVSITVTNDGDSILPDIRLIDNVPARLAVSDGSPRHATALRPGEAATYEYDVLAVYGDHEFDSMHVATRGASGHRERRETVETDQMTLVCEPGVLQEDVPMHPATSGITGRVRSESGGSGQEFRAVREYRRGDPLRRVDWNRLARTGDLASLQFTEEQAATIVLVVDARSSAFKSPAPGSLSALDRSLAGASQLFTNLDSDGDQIGLASMSSELLWIAPSAGPEHRAQVRSTLQNDPTFELKDQGKPFESRRYVEQLRRRLPNDAQLIVLTPLVDEAAVDVIRRLRAYGYGTTVFSPDPTSTETVGSTVARLRREIRLTGLRQADVPLVDWDEGEPLETAVARAGRWDL